MTKASEEYDATIKDNKNLLKMIAEKFEKDAVEDKKDGINWGHVGSIQYVRQLLKEILVFLSKSESEDEALKAINRELEKR